MVVRLNDVPSRDLWLKVGAGPAVDDVGEGPTGIDRVVPESGEEDNEAEEGFGAALVRGDDEVDGEVVAGTDSDVLGGLGWEEVDFEGDEGSRSIIETELVDIAPSDCTAVVCSAPTAFKTASPQVLL